MKRSTLGLVALLASLGAVASSIAADAPAMAAAAATQPIVRTTEVTGVDTVSYRFGSREAWREASAKAYEGALKDAKQLAERGAKTLGARLGLPIKVEIVSWTAPNAPDGEDGYAETRVKVLFELLQ